MLHVRYRFGIKNGMKLADYLSKHGLTHADFASKIGASQADVSRYISGARTPRPARMALITLATKGKVTANDFIPPPTQKRGISGPKDEAA